MRRAVLLVLLALALSSCTVNVGRPAASPSSHTTTVSTTTPAAGHTPIEMAYLADVTTGLGFDQDEEYVTSNPDRMIRVGYEMCQDYRRGVSGSDETTSIQQQLVADPTYLPGLGSARAGSAALAATGIDIAVRAHLCPDVDPWAK